MKDVSIKQFCASVYTEAYDKTQDSLISQKVKQLQRRNKQATADDLSDAILKDIEKAAQKEAIKETIIKGLQSYKESDAALIWRAIYEHHIHRKSGIDDADVVQRVISADQSWKKSSGHAFEEMIKFLGTLALEDANIEIVLQRDLNTRIQNNEIANEPRDISWLKEQIKGNIFDLYAIINTVERGSFCFGCLQCKTSIRDRVTRDREPSIRAMQSYFWPAAIVLDGSWLNMPKFREMVNGGGHEFAQNGWHGMYIFTNEQLEGRIYKTDIDFSIFADHAKQAAIQWLNQRQWFDINWLAKCD